MLGSAHNHKTALRPEVELMLHCARTRMDTPRAEQIRRIVRAGIDWDLLIETCRRHHVLPLLCWNLSNLCSAELPREIASTLRAYTKATLGRNMALTGELFKILQRLQTHQISAVPFKGPALRARPMATLLSATSATSISWSAGATCRQRGRSCFPQACRRTGGCPNGKMNYTSGTRALSNSWEITAWWSNCTGN